MASSLTLANARALRAPRVAPRGVTRASRRAAVVTRASVLTGKSVWIAEDGRKPTPSGGFTQDFLFDLGVPDHPTTPAPLSAVKFEAGTEPVAVTIPRPLGIVFEEKMDGIYTKIVVDEIVPGSNAEKADVRVGDVLRVTSAVFNVPGVIDVTAWLNPPKSSNCKAFFVADQKPFDKVMSAIQSHAVPVDTPDGEVEIGEVGLILERRADA
jgi:hypothetical protein